MKLFACMCNQPQRLRAALAPVRQALQVTPPVSRWGLAYAQSGDVLLVRTPKASALPVDLVGPLAEIATDCAIGQAVHDDRYTGTDNTPPFRYRRWMFAQSGQRDLDRVAPRLLEHVPEYLRRNMKGKTPAELWFHVFLAMLHDEGILDEPNVPAARIRRTLAATLQLVRAEQAHAGAADSDIGTIVASNGRSMVAMRQDTPLRLRRLWLLDDKGARDEAFRGVLLVAGGDGDPKDGFEDVSSGAVLVSRDLQVQFGDHST